MTSVGEMAWFTKQLGSQEDSRAMVDGVSAVIWKPTHGHTVGWYVDLLVGGRFWVRWLLLGSLSILLIPSGMGDSCKPYVIPWCDLLPII